MGTVISPAPSDPLNYTSNFSVDAIVALAQAWQTMADTFQAQTATVISSVDGMGWGCPIRLRIGLSKLRAGASMKLRDWRCCSLDMNVW